MVIKTIAQCIFIAILLVIQVRGDINFCEETIYVQSYQCGAGYIEICTKCQSNYILSDDFSKCYPLLNINTASNQNSPLQSCKRMDQRLLCQEPDRCSVLLESSHYFAKINDDKCAIISDDLSTCVMPKFGYTYIPLEKKYSQVDQSMCAIFNSQTKKCEKYYYRFLPVQGLDYSVFYQDFINFDRVLPNSHSNDIQCQAPYTFQPQNQKYFGCILQQTEAQDNCLKFNEINECEICKESFAINSINGQCEPFPYTFKGCQIQQISGKFSKCLKCQKGYVYDQGTCVEVKNCIFFDQNYPFSCLVCNSPYFGVQCEFQKNIENCVAQTSEGTIGFGTCLKCDNVDFYYTDGNSCILRKDSFNCKEKHPLGDYCNSLTDQDGHYLNFVPYFYEYPTIFRVFKDQERLFTQSNFLNQNHKQYFDSIGVKFAVQGIQLRNYTPVNGCTKYSIVMDLCIECASGKYLQVKEKLTQCVDGVPSRLEGCELEDENQSCFLCKEFYIFDQKIGRCSSDNNKKCIYSYYDLSQNQICLVCAEGSILNSSNSECKQAELCHNDPVKYYQNGSKLECSKGSQYMNTIQIIGSNSPVCIANSNNCKTNVNGTCLDCQNGFTYNTKTKSCIKSEGKLSNCQKTTDSTSCQTCNQNYSLKNEQCISDCLEQQNSCFSQYCASPCFNSYQQCRSCQEGYVLMNGNCVFICPDGQKVYNIYQCPNPSTPCNTKCSACATDNPNYCTSCPTPYIQSNGECVNQCPLGYFNDPAKNICIACTYQCLTCSSINTCTSCSNNNYLTKDGFCCNPSCQSCLDTNPNFCTSCPQSQILVNGICKSDCKPGQYLNLLSECQNCPSQCLTCSSVDKCTTCTSSSTSIETNCLCQESQFILGYKCIKACPFGWIEDTAARKCNRYCQDNQFMEYNQQSQKFQCSQVTDSSSSYCYQIINQIPNLVNLKLKKVDIEDKELFLDIGLNEIPASCFTYKLVGEPSYEILLTTVQASQTTQTLLEAKILKEDLKKPENVKFDDKYYHLNFQIFYMDYLQFSAKVKLTGQFTLVLTNDLEYTGENSEFDTVCEECDVPEDKLVTSSTSVTCDQNINCGQGKISVTTNTQVIITQSITDSQYQNYKLLPHSLKIKVGSQSSNPTIILIQKYTYDNSKLGQITYTFSSLGSAKGTLVVTSKALISRRILESSSALNGYKYSSQQFEIEIKDNNTQNEEGLGITSIILISCFSIVGIVLLIIVTILIIRYRKKQRIMKVYPIQVSQQEQSQVIINQQ